jgi:hypothetical protein
MVLLSKAFHWERERVLEDNNNKIIIGLLKLVRINKTWNFWKFFFFFFYSESGSSLCTI